ncbi:hypothetical protein R5W24_000505 [Gemmata sp. JC717]|uniref:hypothetical protein n=1 Tax=Gemmata algarum TaxID=2975278 RepID=UPI0021BA8366|nr:hypothetical protein [Gemmata algarum]MDY3551429.1 hypothetical protein [Gemmata algarum]
MAAKGMSDEAMGIELGISGQLVYLTRKKHGIPSGKKSGGGNRKSTEPPEPVLEPELIYQENGVTVKRYPARYAETSNWGKVVR